MFYSSKCTALVWNWSLCHHRRSSSTFESLHGWYVVFASFVLLGGLISEEVQSRATVCFGTLLKLFYMASHLSGGDSDNKIFKREPAILSWNRGGLAPPNNAECIWINGGTLPEQLEKIPFIQLYPLLLIFWHICIVPKAATQPLTLVDMHYLQQ